MSERTSNIPFELYASTATIATSTGETAVANMGGYASLLLVLDVTAAATAAADTLDVFVQTKIPTGEWVDVVHFTQVLGNGGAKTFLAKIASSTALTMLETGTALGAAAVRDIIGSELRARFDLVDDGVDNASFTFSVTGFGMAF